MDMEPMRLAIRTVVMEGTEAATTATHKMAIATTHHTPPRRQLQRRGRHHIPPHRRLRLLGQLHRRPLPSISLNALSITPVYQAGILTLLTVAMRTMSHFINIISRRELSNSRLHRLQQLTRMHPRLRRVRVHHLRRVRAHRLRRHLLATRLCPRLPDYEYKLAM